MNPTEIERLAVVETKIDIMQSSINELRNDVKSLTEANLTQKIQQKGSDQKKTNILRLEVAAVSAGVSTIVLLFAHVFLGL